MADGGPMSDSQIAAEFKQFGELIKVPINYKKRKLLLKKLNHLRFRHDPRRSTSSPIRHGHGSSNKVSGPSSSYHHDNNDQTETTHSISPPVYHRRQDDPAFSDSFNNQQSSLGHGAFISEESDLEYDDSASPLNYTTSSRNTSRYDDHGYSRSSTPRDLNLTEDEDFSSYYLPSPDKNYVRNRSMTDPRSGHQIKGKKDVFISEDDHDEAEAQGKSRLYPNLNILTRYFSPSDGNKETFESSDSDEQDSGRKDFMKPFSKFHQTTKGRIENIPSSSSYTPGTSSWKNKGKGPTRRVQKNKSGYTNNLPTILIAVAIIISIALATTYLVLQKDFSFSWFSSSSNIGFGDRLLVCSGNDEQKDCYEKYVVENALHFLHTLFEELSSRKGKVLCGTAKAGDEFIQVAYLKTEITPEFTINNTIEELISCCLDHILANPHWNIRALTKDGTPATSLDNVAKLESEMPSMSAFCRLRRSFSSVMSALCLLIIVVGVLILSFLYMKHILRQKEIEQQEVYAMVENIIEILQDHYEQTRDEESNELPYLAVQHVRDMLLPPASRYKLQPIWDKAVIFIGANESRIRMETNLIHGDEFEVWRWLQPTVVNDKARRSKGKNSDSERSDEDVGSRTQCLKISNLLSSRMYRDENWKDNVIYAILKRCKDVCSIVHVGVGNDSEEGYVFVKCSDWEAADQAKDALYGWLFDDQRITVSPLQTDLYHKLWPEARYATKPLKP